MTPKPDEDAAEPDEEQALILSIQRPADIYIPSPPVPNEQVNPFEIAFIEALLAKGLPVTLPSELPPAAAAEVEAVIEDDYKHNNIDFQVHPNTVDEIAEWLAMPPTNEHQMTELDSDMLNMSLQ